MIAGYGLAVIGWLVTFLIHSTVWLAAGLWLSRSYLRNGALRGWVIVCCVVAPVVTATLAPLGRGPVLKVLQPWQVAEELRTGSAVQSSTIGTGALLLAFVFLVCVLAAGGLRARATLRARRRRYAEIGREASALLGRWAHAMQAQRPPAGLRLRSSARLGSPAALSAREICIPAAIEESLTEGEIDAVLAHELAHVRRRDPAVLFGLTLLSRLFFWQPLYWLAMREYRDAAEHACDDAAVAVAGSGVVVAAALVELAEFAAGDDFAAQFLNGGAGLVDRVERLLAPPATRRAEPAVAIALVGALLVLSLLLPRGALPRRMEAPVERVQRIQQGSATPIDTERVTLTSLRR